MNTKEKLDAVQSAPWLEGEEFNKEKWLEFHRVAAERMALGETVLMPINTDSRKGGYYVRCLFSGGMAPKVLEVTIFGKAKYGRNAGPDQFEVNWSAMGSQSPEMASEYAELLHDAAETASWMNAQAELGLGPWKEV